MSHLVIGLSLLSFSPVEGAESPRFCSPIALAIGSAGDALYAVDATGDRIFHVDPTAHRVLREYDLRRQPTGLTVDDRRGQLIVTTAGPSGQVLRLDASSGQLKSVMRAGHTPMSPVLGADGNSLFVCNRFTNDMSVFDLESGREVKRIPLLREPVGAALSPDGSLLVVVHHKTSDPADSPVVAVSVSLIHTVDASLIRHIQLPNGSIAAQGVCISPDGRYALVSHLLARNHVPATQLENGWLITNAVSIIDLPAKQRAGTVLLDEVGRGAGNPWGIACTQDGRWLLVALAGVHELAVIDLPGLLARLAEHTTADNRATDTSQPIYGHVPDVDLTFLDGLMRRVPLRGKGPRGLAISGREVFVAMYFDAAVEQLVLEDMRTTSATIRLVENPSPTHQRRGEMLFHDASLAFQGWQSCATCHPDGRSDGLNWDLTNDGIGNAKNAKSLLYADRTPPLTMTGIFPSLSECVRIELRTILFTSVADRDAAAIEAYLTSLQPVPSPYLDDGQLSRSAQRGKRVFDKAGCAKCHRGPYYTVMEKRDIGTWVAGDQQRRLDIPSLREVWRTAPYLHHGRARTVAEIFTRRDATVRHGETKDLTPAEWSDLVQYVLSL